MHTSVWRRIMIIFFAIFLSFPFAVQDISAAKKVLIKKFIVKKSGSAAYLYSPRKRYKDEKLDTKNPTSKCLTPAMRTFNKQISDRAEKDGKQFDVTSSTQGILGSAYREYLNGIQMMWSAMEEPYCGYGAFGLKAIRSSYQKNATKIRDRFLKIVKEEMKTVSTKTTSSVKGS